MSSSQIFKESPKNPYFHRVAIRDPDNFWGRVAEIRELLRLTAEGQSVSIVGPRRIGKTSLLLHLHHAAQTVEAGAETIRLFVFLDCQNLYQASQSELLQWMWSKISREAGYGEERCATVESTEDFEEAIRELYVHGFVLALLLDEFELMAANPRLDDGFFTYLRSLTVIYPLSYVTTSVRPLFDLEYSDHSILSCPFFNIFHPQRLGFLKPREALELIDKPARNIGLPGFTEEERDFLIDLAGYHPAFLQIACYHLFEQKLTEQRWNEQAKEQVRQQFREDVEDYFRYIWERELSVGEQEAMRLICIDQAHHINSQLWGSLERKCVIYERKPFSSVFQEFVLQHSAADSFKLIDEVSTEPPSLPHFLAARLNEAELRTLCSDLGLPYDQLPGETTISKARELLAQLNRQERIPDLLRIGKRHRPDIPWNEKMKVIREAPPLPETSLSEAVQDPGAKRAVDAAPLEGNNQLRPHKSDQSATSVSTSPRYQDPFLEGSQHDRGSNPPAPKSDKRSKQGNLNLPIHLLQFLPLGLKLGSFISDSLRSFFDAKPKDPKEIAASQIQLLNAYYLLALKQARRSFLWALVAAVVGLAFFIASLVFLLTQRSQDLAIAGMISGALVQVISGINFYLYGKASSQLADFRTSLDTTQRFLLANSICEGVKGDLEMQARTHLVLAVAGTDATLNSPQASASAQPCPPPPVPDVHITHIDYNPPGDDVKGEYVRIRNSGAASADMLNWTLRDKVGHEFTFPAFILKPGAYVRVWTRPGTNNPTNLYWGRKQAIWNNTGDSAYLRDPSGTLIDDYSYSTTGD